MNNKQLISLKDFNLELYYLGFNASKKSFSNKELNDFLDSEFLEVENWYLNRIK